MMNVELAMKQVVDNISRKADEQYLLALARLWNVDPRTVLIWRILGRV